MTTDQHLNTGSMALGALPGDEAAEFADHLATCSTCAAELASFLETAAILGSSVAQTPPASLRRSVMQAVASTPQLPPLTAPVAFDPVLGRHRQPSEAEDAPASAVPEQGLATVTPLHRPWYRRPQALIAAAVAALVIGGGGGALLARQSAQPASVATGDCVAAATDKAVISPTVGSGGNVTLVPSCDTAVVAIPALPAAPAGKVYQVWVIKGSNASSIAVMNPSANGSPAPFSTSVHAGDSAIGVTVEPAPGSAKPTTTPFWVVPLTA